MQEHVKKLYDERVQLLHDAARSKKTSRVPLLSVASDWALADGGYPYSETLRNWDMVCKAVVEYEKRYHFDFIFRPGTRNPIRIGEAFGSNNYLVDDESYSITVLDSCLMEESEYDEITRERVKYLWEKFLPRKTGNATKEQLLQSIIEFTKLCYYTICSSKPAVDEWARRSAGLAGLGDLLICTGILGLEAIGRAFAVRRVRFLAFSPKIWYSPGKEGKLLTGNCYLLLRGEGRRGLAHGPGYGLSY